MIGSDHRERGPAIGEAFPNIQLPDQRGKLVDLHEQRRDRRAVVVFVRSVVW